ncbi:related to Valine amino-acid permease [Saccharomycodes ludwigii]|uniref:Related to Valine amino-acid permease n=1 Tax=Saccharomycodes ludwigii TaxID=36035 RepID=A0A376B9R6_9ASCO|nr:hypothetical protein SCDLUD_002122 [Saccharomycodes ludwigii]KAH3902302.1 hypothetical protein SCDLUD_002122 [Saccharomycodes ludwigii]SSD61425.1 related to Valine amino-acid permease [Saccharomycodes ludwigii]
MSSMEYSEESKTYGLTKSPFVISSKATTSDFLIEENLSIQENLSPYKNEEYNKMKETIKSRHTKMISMATGLGTGLLVGLGHSIRIAGIGGTLLGYGLISIMIILCFFASAELVVAFPRLPGGFNSYGKKFIHPSVGFTISWLFCINWEIILPLELVTASMTIKYWNNNISPSIFVAIFYSLILAISFFGARGFAEAEFWFNLSKILMVTGFIILGGLIISGVVGANKSDYLQDCSRFWKSPGSFNTNNNIFKSIASTLVNSCFACGGVEFVALSCAEQSKKNLVKSIKNAGYQVIIRMVLLFLLSITVIGFLVPYTSPELLGSNSKNAIHASPYVIAIASNGIKIVPHIINAVILIAVLSVANSAMYSSSRTLNSLSQQGFAPKFFKKLDSNGIPVRCMVVSALIGLLSFIAEYNDQEKVFIFLLSISGLSTIFNWAMICIAHIRFRTAMKAQCKSLEELGYKSPTGVLGSYIAIIINVLILVLGFWVSLFPLNNDGKASFVNLSSNYLAVAVGIVLYFGHKIATKNWTFYIKADKIDVDGDRDVYALIINDADVNLSKNNKKIIQADNTRTYV